VSETRTIAVVGAGLIGRAWAAIFARAGWTVRPFDPTPGQAAHCCALCDDALNQLARHGLCDDADGALARISIAETLAEALAGVALVQENTPEIVHFKRALYADLDRPGSHPR
jgi:L-gulonate 3-dehydrogenase